ncbi:YdcF family protein [Methylobacterium sp. Leaf108]|uniref:YdcF family protein n=1 Tax=Methylobacterium sp. Leaf108 TaxID=1736256 RepID=UPI0009EBD046|nr:YdcF family protein [Methylobacterium sp. Leaf108]
MSGDTTISPRGAFGWAWDEAPPRGPALSAPPVRSRPPSVQGRALRGAAVVGGIGVAALLGGFLSFVACIDRDERALSERPDAIVALTGGAQRIGDAIDLLASGYGRRLLITGVNERTSRDEITRLNPSQRHWIECCVDLDYRARNTIGNAIETRRWMRLHRFNTVAVVTSNYHMPRTLIELDHALAGRDRVVPHPVVAEGVGPHWWQSPASTRLLASEYVKFLVAWVRTRFENDPETSRAAVLIGRRKPVRVVSETLMREND